MGLPDDVVCFGAYSGSPLPQATYPICHLSTGDMLRDAVKSETEIGKTVKPIVERGELVPDALIIGIIKEELKKPACSKVRKREEIGHARC